MTIRNASNRNWLDRAYEYVEQHGPSTATQLREGLFMNPLNNRPFAHNPTRHCSAMLLKMDKRFIGTTIKVAKTNTNDGQYVVNCWAIKGDE